MHKDENNRFDNSQLVKSRSKRNALVRDPAVAEAPEAAAEAEADIDPSDDIALLSITLDIPRVNVDEMASAELETTGSDDAVKGTDSVEAGSTLSTVVEATEGVLGSKRDVEQAPPSTHTPAEPKKDIMAQSSRGSCKAGKTCSTSGCIRLCPPLRGPHVAVVSHFRAAGVLRTKIQTRGPRSSEATYGNGARPC